jgi:hypothetical protein
MKDILIKDFEVFVQAAEKNHIDDLQRAMEQSLMFGGNFCSTCGSRLMMARDIDICSECAITAAKIYKAMHNLKFLE